MDIAAPSPEFEAQLRAWRSPSRDRHPVRPRPIVEALGSRLLRALAPKTPSCSSLSPPAALAPWSPLTIHTEGSRLSATWFPAQGFPAQGFPARGFPAPASHSESSDADGKARGVVVLAHPWVPGGQAYFFRRSRLKALRQAGYHALTFDFPGFGDSERWQPGFLDRDLSAVLDFVDTLAPGLPKFFWGVSAGGYWGHLSLSSRSDITAAVFEETPIHLIDWSDRVAPQRRWCHAFYRRVLAPAYRFLDLRRHAAHLQVSAASYISGLDDPGILPAETHELARLAKGQSRIVPNANHLDVIKRAGKDWTQMVLQTFSMR